MFRPHCLVDGFNLPLLVVPSGQNCSSTGCIGDVIESCPTELQVTNGTEGKRVRCKSACDALSSSLDRCKPSLYSNFYNNLCPQSYSYAYDDTNATYTCPSTDYQIIFCPGKSINTTSYRPNPIRNTTGVTANNSRPSSGEITPISMPEIRPNATSRRDWKSNVQSAYTVFVIICLVVIVVIRVRRCKSDNTEEDVEDDIQQVPGMPVSFGIVLLEVVCARKNVDHSQPESAFHLLRMLQEKAGPDRLIDIVKNLDDQYMPSDREEIIT
ncbi:hypothetical protein OIU85_022982 [Salix viminalis]|uniref:Uncharacterized protein n=1 Tax=Salix viminalis TaxID=40686 RepID=A0A9Q0U819_SALVM|nr:hypothetical protein OIU85_022982 [Salix viminalis]